MATSSFAVAAQRNRRRAKALSYYIEDALEETGMSGVGKARVFSSGAVPQSEFDRAPGASVYANHPYGYGRRNARGPRGSIPYGDPGIINNQTGIFYLHWNYEFSVSSANYTLIVYNDAPYARFMEQSTRMRFRPICQKILVAERPFYLARLAAARRKAMAV